MNWMIAFFVESVAFCLFILFSWWNDIDAHKDFLRVVEMCEELLNEKEAARNTEATDV